MNKKTQRLAVSGIMIGLATALSLITIFRLPYGGSVTLFSMLPILLVAYSYDKVWGILTGIIYGILQAVLGASTSSAFAGLDFLSVILVLMLDYLIAFGVLGLSGIFKKVIPNIYLSFALGILFSTILRYLVHFISGYIVFGSYAEWFFSQESVSYGNQILNTFSGKSLAAIYSLVYNATYMVPEIIISVIAGVSILKIPPIKRFCKNSSF